MQAFQERGESHRQRLGIGGTAGDAQDVEHPYIEDVVLGCCVVCGLARSHRKHVAEEALVIRPGDHLIVRVKQATSFEVVDLLLDVLRERFPGVEVVVIAAEQLAVFRG